VTPPTEPNREEIGPDSRTGTVRDLLEIAGALTVGGSLVGLGVGALVGAPEAPSAAVSSPAAATPVSAEDAAVTRRMREGYKNLSEAERVEFREALDKALVEGRPVRVPMSSYDPGPEVPKLDVSGLSEGGVSEAGELAPEAVEAVEAVEVVEVPAEAGALAEIGSGLAAVGPLVAGVGAVTVAVAAVTGIPQDEYVGKPIQRQVAEYLKATGEAPPEDPGGGADPMSGWNPYAGVE
jgi:hypothetical protein